MVHRIRTVRRDLHFEDRVLPRSFDTLYGDPRQREVVSELASFNL
jgi:hypothetical protein